MGNLFADGIVFHSSIRKVLRFNSIETWDFINALDWLSFKKSEGNEQRFVDSRHHVERQFADFFFQTAFVERAYLFEKNYGVFGQTVFARFECDMRGQFCLVELRCDCGGDYRRAVFVANVVLHDENGAYSALLAAHDGA